MLTPAKLASIALLISSLLQTASSQHGTTRGQEPRRPEILSIPARVAEGLLVEKHAAVCPAIVKTGHLSGNVVLQVTITETGAVENLSVKSGPASLQQAALTAVKTYRYRPYLIRYKPVRVSTTVNVVFNSQSCI